MSTYKIVPDTDPQNPRTEWDNLGTIYCPHARYALSDDGATPPAKGNIILPVYMYEHSGIALSTDNSQYPFNCLWDAGPVGVIYVSKGAVRKAWGKKRITKAILRRVLEILKDEVKIYSNYLSGDACGFIISDENGEEIDACYGFYDYESAEKAAKEYMQ